MSTNQYALSNYMKQSELVIDLQKEMIRKLKETVAAKTEMHNLMVEYIGKIYEHLNSENLSDRKVGMTHLKELANIK